MDRVWHLDTLGSHNDHWSTGVIVGEGERATLRVALGAITFNKFEFYTLAGHRVSELMMHQMSKERQKPHGYFIWPMVAK